MSRCSRRPFLVAFGTACLVSSTIAFSGEPCNPEQGADVYANKCAICHSVVEGHNGVVGPSLFGIIGRIPARAPAFSYSASMTNLKDPWTERRIDWFLQDPPARVPGTYMAFTGLRDPAARAAVVCYLVRLTK